MLFDEEDPDEETFEREIENKIRESLGMDRKSPPAEASDDDAHAGDAHAGDAAADTTDALQRLRSRYAAGELTDEQFENKLDRLLETETPEDAAEWRRRAAREAQESERGTETERDRETEREREPDR